MQTDEPLLVSDESQTEQTKSSEIDSQTDPPSTKSFICQTELITSSEVEVQAVRAVEFSLVECQTDALNHEEVEVQTELDISVSQSQTDNVDVGHIEMQTDMVSWNNQKYTILILSDNNKCIGISNRCAQCRGHGDANRRGGFYYFQTDFRGCARNYIFSKIDKTFTYKIWSGSCSYVS